MTLKNQVLQGDCLDVLRDFPDNYFSAVVTDPPYGLGEIKDLPGLLMAWMNDTDERQHVGKGGFMNRSWDAICPSPMVWRAVYRVMKPGAHLLCFAGTRTFDLMGLSIRLAGFENRDTIQHFHGATPGAEWVHGSGFPKSLNLGSGYGTALKPSHEPILLFRKPIDAGTIAANVSTYGTGGLNIDACRIDGEPWDRPTMDDIRGNRYNQKNASLRVERHSDGGRHPPNVVFTHSIWCQPDACTPDCPVFQLDAQAGERKNGGQNYVGGKQNSVFGNTQVTNPTHYAGDTGSASRFFPQFWPSADDAAPFKYVSKPARSERDKGCELLESTSAADMVDREPGSAGMQSPRAGAGRTSGGRNSHPTVKPISLARWLCRLVGNPGAVIVDPFCGSGSTLIAAVREGFDCIGIDQDMASVIIARNRLGAETGLWDTSAGEATR